MPSPGSTFSNLIYLWIRLVPQFPFLVRIFLSSFYDVVTALTTSVTRCEYSRLPTRYGVGAKPHSLPQYFRNTNWQRKDIRYPLYAHSNRMNFYDLISLVHAATSPVLQECLPQFPWKDNLVLP